MAVGDSRTFSGTVAAVPSATEILLDRCSWSIQPTQPGMPAVQFPQPVTLLYDRPGLVAHLQVGDRVTFLGIHFGSAFMSDQWPIDRNPHRRRIYAWYFVWASRPAP
jgi:hypothetical protein